MKITCASCRHEKDKWCLVKKIGIAINKRRNCDKYDLNPDKVKAKQIIKSVYHSYEEREALKKLYKEQMKKLKADGEEFPGAPRISDPKHPLTGDLSRFMSTVEEIN